MTAFDIIMNIILLANVGCTLFLVKEVRRMGREIKILKGYEAPR